VTTPSKRDELLRNFEKLSPEKQRELMAHARSLAESARSVRGTPGKNSVAFSGVIEPTEAAKIAQAIEDCEQVDRSTW
jgi:hypothetical protein